MRYIFVAIRRFKINSALIFSRGLYNIRGRAIFKKLLYMSVIIYGLLKEKFALLIFVLAPFYNINARKIEYFRNFSEKFVRDDHNKVWLKFEEKELFKN